MTKRPLETLMHHLRRMAGPRDRAPSGDADLLHRYICSGDESAFAEIVQRHGPLVWAICRSRLSAADADDSFQATFLVLARRAKSIRKPASLACWLSGVARRTVQTVQTRQLRRREVALDADVSARATADSELAEQQTIVAEELDRLPEKYRLPMHLCYMQGLTNEEAAARLSWPHGTVCGRLARARDILRKRLARRGVMLTIGAAGLGSTAQPAELLATTIQTCLTGGTLWKPTVITLAEGAMQAMWMTKVKLAAGAALSVAVLGAGTGWVLAPATAHDGIVLAATAQDEKQPPAKSPAPSSPQKSWEVAEKEAMELLQNAIKSVEQTSPLAKAQPNDDALRSLIKERHRTAVLELTLRLHVFKAGARGGSIEVLLGSADRAYESEIALVTSNAEKLKAAQRSVEIATAILAVNKSRREVGQIADQDVEQSRYYMLGTQIRLMQAEQKVAK